MGKNSASSSFSISGWTIGVIAIIIVIVVPLNMRENRELVYAVNPLRTQVVTMGKTTELHVLFEGKILGDSDVTAIQLAIWNKGDLSIRTENILKDITINLNPPTQILEASIIKYNREQDVTGIELVTTPEYLNQGIVKVTWKILEKNDGASIQLIYLGSTDTEILVNGLIEGSSKVNKVIYGINIKSPEEQISSRQNGRWIAIGMLLFSFIFVAMGTFISYKKSNEKKDIFMPIIMILPLIGLSIYILIDSLRPLGPPFGF